MYAAFIIIITIISKMYGHFTKSFVFYARCDLAGPHSSQFICDTFTWYLLCSPANLSNHERTRSSHAFFGLLLSSLALHAAVFMMFVCCFSAMQKCVDFLRIHHRQTMTFFLTAVLWSHFGACETLYVTSYDDRTHNKQNSNYIYYIGRC